MESLTNTVWILPFAPLLGFLFLVFRLDKFSINKKPEHEKRVGWLATSMVITSFVFAVVQFIALLSLDGHDRSVVRTLYSWIPIGDLQVDISFLIDPLSVVMILFITGVGALIHVYATYYMSGDRDYPRFFAYLNLFVFAMIVLVLADNLLLSFLGWEGVGVCSYFLISFWFDKRENASAGTKAFITNRVGDFGFMLAIFFSFQAFGVLNWVDIFQELEENPIAASTASVIVLCLMLGAAGKSAQIPLQVWLPNAMAGPTPVSALIHAATMVTAGVYLLVRVSPLLQASYAWVPEVIMWIGLVTAIIAALSAMAQKDIKRVLAYSTISQLGFMFVAIGAGAPVAAIFHMITHAFFKALLFLGAGSVAHAMGGEQDINKMGGLWRHLKFTTPVFLIGWLAISGVPPFSGFWSKDEILAYVWNSNRFAWVLLLFAATLTAFYMTRLIVKVFFGKPNWKKAPHESGRGVLIPLFALAGLATFAGILNLPFTNSLLFLEHWLEPVLENGFVEHLSFGGGTQWILAIISIIVGAVGIWLAYQLFYRKRYPKFAQKVESPFFHQALYIDRTLTNFVGKKGFKLFQDTADFDDKVIDGAVMGVAQSTLKLGGLIRFFQTGKIRSYALWITLGAVAFLIYFLVRVL